METNNLNGMFGKIANGMCRFTMNGDIAIKTSNGYKTYDVKNGILTNVNNFCFDLGCDFFFLMPTTRVAAGDIVLIDGKPKCVIDANKRMITAIDYETAEVKQIIPERQVMMGNVFFYGKIVSLLGQNFKGQKGFAKMMRMMVISQMMGTNRTQTDTGLFNGNIGQMMAMTMMMNNGNGGMFDDIFDNFDIMEENVETLNEED